MWKGSFVALPTPFTEEDTIDWKALVTLIEWHIDARTDGIVVCGTTGESPTLTCEEREAIFKESVRVARGRIPIVAGTGSYSTRESVAATRAAKESGVDAALVILPYYNRPTAEGCLQHFQEISAVGLPLIVYHHPGRTGIKLSVKALAQIAELPNIAAIKEASGDVDFAIELMQAVNVPVFSGDDTLALPLMAAGAVGVISIVANVIPEDWRQLTELLLAGKLLEARTLFYRLYPLIKAMVLETNPQCVKYALSVMGKCSARMRLPLIEPQEAVKRQLNIQLGREKAALGVAS